MAEDWKKGRVNNHVNVYELSLKKLSTCKIHIKRFERANEEWAKFVYNNRKNKIRSCKYDIVIGPFADNGIEDLFRKLEDGEIDWNVLSQKLEFRRFDAIQYCFMKPNAIKLLEYATRK